MKLIKTLVAAFALLSFAAPSYAQGSIINQLGAQAQNLFMPNANGNRRGALPPVTLDSFVTQAGGAADAIYGDEGDIDIPPIDSFTKENRINAGIFGQRDAGLTTGHGSFMPDAWGADEFLAPPGEWGWSGARNGNNNQMIEATQLNLLQAAAGALARSSLATNTSNSNITSGANVSGSDPNAVPAWVSAFGSWATAAVPYAVTQGMKPVQDSTNGQLMGWLAPGESLSSFLAGNTGRLLPSETAAAAKMLANLPANGDFVLPLP
ncbi:MAG: hypothetical protein JSS83_19860 [Cyanobacteria bacterium SZAS LIN-3]|nr:hypothetical protein [Cyanobacteria bacterium SZAS LIN-3]MBS2005579.1 hypothetical protein [Cyanobacteria bacterium SZAS TMP-1]